jgi:DNA-binding NtrC family response regulator
MSAVQIIVAEDEAPLREIISEVLTEKGFGVIEAADGAKALRLVQDNPGASLLLSDIWMPHMNGYELVEAALKSNPELKVVMMTGYAHEQPPSAALAAREIKVLVKPVNLDHMCNVISDMLSRA